MHELNRRQITMLTVIIVTSLILVLVGYLYTTYVYNAQKEQIELFAEKGNKD